MIGLLLKELSLFKSSAYGSPSSTIFTSWLFIIYFKGINQFKKKKEYSLEEVRQTKLKIS